MKTIIGIDPGKGGGIAVIDEQFGSFAHSMPDTLLDLKDLLSDIILNRDHSGLFRCYLEKVSSSPQMGVVSAFTFGRGLGQLEGIITALGLPLERIAPQVWQKALGCLSKGDKNVTKRKAQELFPSLKITHATADALLIAEYGRRISV